jgi:hypothetical protein
MFNYVCCQMGSDITEIQMGLKITTTTDVGGLEDIIRKVCGCIQPLTPPPDYTDPNTPMGVIRTSVMTDTTGTLQLYQEQRSVRDEATKTVHVHHTWVQA